VIQRSTRCSNKDAARKIEAAWRTADALNEVGLSSAAQQHVTLLQLEKRFFSYLGNRVATSTVQFYKTAWVPISFSPLYMVNLQRIDSARVEEFVQRRKLEGVRPATINNSLKTLRRVLHLAYEWKFLSRIPKIRLLTGERSREFIISEELLATIVNKATPVMRQLLPFLIDSGLRISEAVELTWETVSLEPKQDAHRGWVFVTKGKTPAARRYVPLTARAAAIIAERIAAKGSSQFVWTLKRSKRLTRTWASKLFHAIAKEMELPWDAVLHSTRHTFCTRLGESGADAFTIKQLAGHASILISQRYVHPTPARLENAIGALEASTKTAVEAVQ